MASSTSVSTGSSRVKSWSKLLTSLLVFCGKIRESTDSRLTFLPKAPPQGVGIALTSLLPKQTSSYWEQTLSCFNEVTMNGPRTARWRRTWKGRMRASEEEEGMMEKQGSGIPIDCVCAHVRTFSLSASALTLWLHWVLPSCDPGNELELLSYEVSSGLSSIKVTITTPMTLPCLL